VPAADGAAAPAAAVVLASSDAVVVMPRVPVQRPRPMNNVLSKQSTWEVPSELPPLPPLPPAGMRYGNLPYLKQEGLGGTALQAKPPRSVLLPRTPPAYLPHWYHYYAASRKEKLGILPSMVSEDPWGKGRRARNVYL
jgi:hypothetical protein